MIECTRCGVKVPRNEACINLVRAYGRPMWTCKDCDQEILLERVPNVSRMMTLYIPTWHGYKRRRQIVYKDEIKELLDDGIIISHNDL